MKIITAIRWIIYLIIFLLLAFLIIGNSQSAKLNIYGLFSIDLPFITYILISLILGFVIGIVIMMFYNAKLRLKLKKTMNALKRSTQLQAEKGMLEKDDSEDIKGMD